MTNLTTAFLELLLGGMSIYILVMMAVEAGGSEEEAFHAFFYAFIAYAITTVAGFSGVIKYGMDSPPSLIRKVFDWVSWLGGTIGLLLIGAQLLEEYDHFPYQFVLLGFAVVAILGKIFSESNTKRISEGVFLVAVVNMGIMSYFEQNIIGGIGTGALILGFLQARKNSGDVFDSNSSRLFYNMDFFIICHILNLFCMYQFLSHTDIQDFSFGDKTGAVDIDGITAKS